MNKNFVQIMKQHIYKIVVASILLVIGVRFIVEPYYISGDCMEPAIMHGTRHFADSLSPYLRTYKIDDIVVFKHEGINWFARVVALEHDTIKIVEGKILVNGQSVSNDISRNWSGWKFGTYAIGKTVHVPAKHVFVLSDNLSAHHDDSRVFGPISYSSIIGVLW